LILKPKDAAILIEQTQSESSVLVGGQAVAFWTQYFGLQPRLPGLTGDVDYLGTKAEAKRASARLTLPHKLKVATLDDATPNTAVLSVEMEGYADPVLIDYLASIVGIETKHIEKTAVSVTFEGKPLRVIHPLLLLQAKIWNLYRLEEKRTPEGIEQARLAIEIAAAYIEEAKLEQREILKAVELIGKFSATAPARFAQRYGLDCMNAIPETVLKPGVLPSAFHEKRWPQILAATR
jgi:hypothetical protein